jgi:hypothetical protein
LRSINSEFEGKKMKISKDSNKIVFVISGDGGACPTLLLEGKRNVLSDDFKGSIKLTKHLISKISSL